MMQEFLAQVCSPVFCFSTVIVALIVGVMANRTDRFLDRFFGSISRRWAARSEKKALEYANRLRSLRESDIARHAHWVRVLRLAVIGLSVSFFGMFLGTFGIAIYFQGFDFNVLTGRTPAIVQALIFTVPVAVPLALVIFGIMLLIFAILMADDFIVAESIDD